VGLALLAAGILYFLLLGRWVLPASRGSVEEKDFQQEIVASCGLSNRVHRARIPEDSELVGKTLEEAGLWQEYGLHVLLAKDADGDEHPAPWRHTVLEPGQELVYLGDDESASCFFCDHGLLACEETHALEDRVGQGERSGFAELIVLPRAPIEGQSIRQFGLRKNLALVPMALTSAGRTVRGDFSDTPLHAGDTLVVHGEWERVKAAGEGDSFLLVTPIKAPPREQSRDGLLAAACFGGAILLALLGFPLSISLLTGAVATIVLRVVPVDEAWKAVDWRTVFLLAGLIPLGIAMERTGTAAYVAEAMMGALGGAHPFVLLLAVAGLTTLFSLFMSNVAAAVILVPLVAVIAQQAGLDPRGMGLLVAVAASNSFLLPTHQVNALLMGPGGYRNADYLRAGGPLTLLIAFVAAGLIYAFYV
jgi:di/tricarboxylate transporter